MVVNISNDGLKDLTKKYGKMGIIRLGAFERASVDVIKTGSFSLDKALGVGGIPLGRITEIYGPESSGKTSLCLNIIKNAQEAKYECAFIDCEHAFDREYADKIGVDTNKLLFAQPSCGEEGFEMIYDVCDKNLAKLIVVDSVPALIPKAVIDAETGQDFMGLQARLMSKGIQKINAIISKNQIAVIFINQIRMKIGCVSPETRITWRKQRRIYGN